MPAMMTLSCVKRGTERSEPFDKKDISAERKRYRECTGNLKSNGPKCMCMEPSPKAETIAMTANAQPMTAMIVLTIFMFTIVWIARHTRKNPGPTSALDHFSDRLLLARLRVVTGMAAPCPPTYPAPLLPTAGVSVGVYAILLIASSAHSTGASLIFKHNSPASPHSTVDLQKIAVDSGTLIEAPP